MAAKEGTELQETRMTRTIKRYESRKLYDSQESRYVSLQEVAEWIRDGQQIEVIDNATSESVTEQTLAQIILEEGKSGRGRLSSELLHNMVRAGGKSLSNGVSQMGRGFNRLVQASFDRLGPVKEAREEMSQLRGRLDELEATLAAFEAGTSPGQAASNDAEEQDIVRKEAAEEEETQEKAPKARRKRRKSSPSKPGVAAVAETADSNKE